MKAIFKQRIELEKSNNLYRAYKYHYSYVHSMQIELYYNADDSDFNEDQEKVNLLRLSKTKTLKKLNILNTARELKTASRTLMFMKKQKDVKNLQLDWIPFGKFSICLATLQNFKRLSSLGLVCAKDFKTCSSTIENKIKRFLSYLNGSRILSLDLQSSVLQEQLYKFSRYPQTLEKLKVSLNMPGKNRIEFKPNLIKLKCLDICIIASQEVSIDLLNSIAQHLKNIECLYLDFPGVLRNKSEIPDFFTQNLTETIKHVSLNFGFQIKGEMALVEKLSPNKGIQTFVLDSHQQSWVNLEIISNCLNRWENLQNLKLKIYKNWKRDEEANFLRALPEKLSHLTQLRTLELCLFSIQLYYDILPDPMQISFDFLENLPFLRKFTIKSRAVEPGAVPQILKIFSKRSTLEYLNLNLELYCLLKDSFNDLIQFIKNSDGLRVLKLPGVIISNPSFLKEMTHLIVSKKRLEKLMIGKFLRNISLECFLTCIEKILLMKGFSKFVMVERQMITEKWDQELRKVYKKTKQTNPDLERAFIRKYTISSYCKE